MDANLHAYDCPGRGVKPDTEEPQRTIPMPENNTTEDVFLRMLEKKHDEIDEYKRTIDEQRNQIIELKSSEANGCSLMCKIRELEDYNAELRAAALAVHHSVLTVANAKSVNTYFLNVTKANFNALAKALGQPERIE